jgi:hypothetical protein
MAWAGPSVPAWCQKAFDEYKANLDQHWNLELFRSLEVPQSFILHKEYDRFPFFAYKSDIF